MLILDDISGYQFHTTGSTVWAMRYDLEKPKLNKLEASSTFISICIEKRIKPIFKTIFRGDL